MLLELAVELRAYATGERLEDKLNHFQNTILEWHEALSTPTSQAAPPHPLAILEGGPFEKPIRGFADMLRLMERPVVLILDTCEELAKSPVVDSIMPSVEATFTILERIHAKVPTVRVIFAGRRLLARAGSDWRIKEPPAQDRKDSALPAEGRFLPASKTYLRLHEIRGFTKNDNDPAKSEVDRYFTEKKGLSPTSDLRDAILARSAEVGSLINIRRTEPTVAREEARFNPFDLSLYSDWLREDPTLTAETIRSGKTDPYVELRIVQRIKQEQIQRALPAVVLLRRFDQQMLRPMIGDSSLFDLYRELGEQEWITYQIDESRQVSLLEVNRNLHRRLLDYYEHPSRHPLLDDARRKLAPALIELARRPLNELVSEHLNATLRVLPPADAGEMWEDVMRRLPAERDWNWLQNVIKLLRSEVGAISEDTDPLFPAVRAAEVSAQIHLTPSLNVASAWEEVAATAAHHPDPEIKRWLAARALAGRVAASRDEKLLPELWKLIEEFPGETAKSEAARERHSQLTASLIAALESLQEAIEAKSNPDLRPFPSLSARLATDSLPPELRAFIDTLTMRGLIIRQQWNDARAQLARINLASKLLPLPRRQKRWFDWRAPDSFVDRLRLEALRLLPVNVSEKERAHWLEDATSRVDTIDAERLASLIVQLRLAHEVVSERTLGKLVEAEKYDANRLPTCNAHRAVPPLIVSIAQAYLALGRATDALAVLNRRTDQTVVHAQDQGQQHAIEIAEAQVIWRMRMTSNARTFVSRMTSSSNPQRQALIGLLRTVVEPFKDPIPSITWSQFPIAEPRHSAEKAMEAGDWAHVQPEQGCFDEAFDSFRIANDPVGAFIAVAKGVITLIHAGKVRSEPMRQLLRRRLQEAYERLHPWHQLPKWEYLIELSNDPRRETLAALPANVGWPDWEGWLLRLVGCLVWLNDATEDRQRLEQWRTWLTTRYSSALPVELDLPPVEEPRAEGPVEYSNAWFALYGAIKLVFITLIGFMLAATFWSAFIIGANTGAEVWSYLKAILGLLVLVFFRAMFEEDEKEQKGEGWWNTLKRLLQREKDHPGRFHQFAVNTLGRLQQAGLFGAGIAMLVGQFLILRWLFRALGIASFVQGVLTTLLLIAFVTGLLMALRTLRKRIKAAFQSLATRNDLHFETGNWAVKFFAAAATDRPDAAAHIYFSVNLRRREIVVSFPFFNITPLTHVFNWVLSPFLPYVSKPEDQQLTEIDPRQLWPAMWNSVREIIRLAVRVYSAPAIETWVVSQTSGLVAYATAAEKMPTEVVAQLKEAKTRLWFFESAVALHIAPSLAFVPWEAMLTIAVNDGAQASIEDKLLFFRAAELLPDPERERAVQAWQESSLATMGTTGWAALSKAWGLAEVREPLAPRVLHVLGKPLLTSSGVRLQSGPGDPVFTPSRGGNLISPVNVRLNDAWLVVLQAEPIEILARLETDREQSALLRVFAAEVFAAGAPAVLSLPPMDPTLAEQVIKLLAEKLNRSSPPAAYQLAKAVNEVQQLIAEWRRSNFKADESAQAQIIANQLELALDVCLFARQRSIETVLSKKEG